MRVVGILLTCSIISGIIIKRGRVKVKRCGKTWHLDTPVNEININSKFHFILTFPICNQTRYSSRPILDFHIHIEIKHRYFMTSVFFFSRMSNRSLSLCKFCSMVCDISIHPVWEKNGQIWWRLHQLKLQWMYYGNCQELLFDDHTTFMILYSISMIIIIIAILWK